MISMEALY